MKMTKGLILTLASFSLFACSSEEVINEPVAVSGPVALTLKVNTPSLSRATGALTTDKAVTVDGDLVVRFLGTSGAVLGSTTVDYATGQGDASKQFTIFNVPEGTTGIAIVGNGNSTVSDGNYSAAFSSTSDEQTGKGAAGVTVYGTDLTLTANGTVSEDGKNTIYAKYEAEVSLQPVTARLEVGGIKFAQATPSNLTSLKVTDAFINGAYLDGEFVVDGTEKVTPSNPTYFTGANIGELTTYPLKDSFTESNILVGTDAVETFPATGCIGYNFFVDNWGANDTSESNVTGENEQQRANLPYFTLKMDAEYNESVSDGSSSGDAAPLYAVITKYMTKEGTEIKSFLPGKLYQITSIDLPEAALTPDPEGNQTIAVVATVTVKDWVIVPTTGEWSGQN